METSKYIYFRTRINAVSNIDALKKVENEIRILQREQDKKDLMDLIKDKKLYLQK